jgi:hypothetical protein
MELNLFEKMAGKIKWFKGYLEQVHTASIIPKNKILSLNIHKAEMIIPK